MHLLTTYEQVGTFEPTNPDQTIRTAYAYPGGYASFYFNRVPNAGTLQGLGFWSGLPTWGQIALVAAAATTVGYFGMAKFGDKYVKPGLRKVGINLSGPRSRRRGR